MTNQSIPKVSVVIPVYKTPIEYFKACLESLHSQTLSSTQFIIVFDGPNNALFSLCENYQKKDERFELFVQPNSGVSATRNFGIQKARGEYLTFVDADDSIEKDCCLDVYKFAKETKAEVILFDYIPTDRQYKSQQMFSESIPELSKETTEELQKQAIYLTDDKYVAAVSTWCKFFKKDLINNNHLSFSTNLKICVDRPFSFSAFLFAKKISYLNKFYYNYNKVGSSITWSFHKNRTLLTLAHLTEIKKISQKFSDLIGRRALQIFLDAWETEYFSKNSWQKTVQSVKSLQQTIKSNEFQNLIETVDETGLPPRVKIELFLFQHRTTFHIWLHAIKWIALSKFKEQFKKN